MAIGVVVTGQGGFPKSTTPPTKGFTKPPQTRWILRVKLMTSAISSVENSSLASRSLEATAFQSAMRH